MSGASERGSAAALDALFCTERGGRTPISWGYLFLCVSLTLLGLVFPSVERLLGSVGEVQHPWQPFTSVFMHGWPGFPALVHLALNSFLILECGRSCERLLGAGRFLVLCLGAAGGSAALQFLTEGVNGSSQVIWSWGPALLVALLWARRRGASERGPGAARIRGVLVLMYLVIIGVMGALPYAFGWRGNPFVALLRANQFHLTATLVGGVAALVWRPAIERRLEDLTREVAGR